MSAKNLTQALHELLRAGGLAELGPNPRPGALALADIDAKLNSILGDARFTPAEQDLLKAAVYLWHDHLDESHRLAQEIETPDGSLIHAIMHRREPDYWNSKYWFRRVGAHPSFLGLAAQAGPLLEKAGESDLQSRLLPNKTWDPFAFVDAVEEALNGQFRSKIPLLREIQKLEFESLLENLAERLP